MFPLNRQPSSLTTRSNTGALARRMTPPWHCCGPGTTSNTPECVRRPTCPQAASQPPVKSHLSVFLRNSIFAALVSAAPANLALRRSSCLLRLRSHGASMQAAAEKHSARWPTLFPLSVSKTELPTLFMLVRRWLSFLDGCVSKDLQAFLVAPVIFKCFFVASPFRPAVFGRSFRDEQGQQRHNHIPGSLHTTTRPAAHGSKGRMSFLLFAEEYGLSTPPPSLC